MLKFLKEWGVLILLVVLILLSRIFIWDTVSVDGNSMDPNLANGQKLIIAKVGAIKRFDIVVAQETTAQSQKNDPTATSGKKIIKRVIGMPGDTVSYNHDKLTINGKQYSEPYLANYQKLFDDKKLAQTYADTPLNSSFTSAQKSFFVSLAETSKAFTTDNTGNPTFTIHVPAGQYLLLGDDRVVSADSRKVGTFSRSQIIGKALFRIWPLNKIGGL